MLRVARVLYRISLCVVWPFLLLYYLCRSGTDGKYGSNYLARMGLRLPEFAPCPRRIWLHALSVGEVLSAVPLVREIKASDPQAEIVVSVATETGMAIARDRLAVLAAHFFFMPHDFPWTVRTIVKRVRPAAFLLVETDFWLNLLGELRRAGVPTMLVNGRISPVSFDRYKRFRAATSAIFGEFDLIFAQTERDRQNFVALGGIPERIFASGNLKFDSLPPRATDEEIAGLRTDLGIDSCRRVWVAGSTHEGEEEILLRIHSFLQSRYEDLLLVIAPRKIRRSAEIARMCRAESLSCGIRSLGERAEGNAVYLLDSLGELGKVYALAGVAFLGGSLVPLGGHNPLEAAVQGTVACWGPHFFNFSEIGAGLIQAGCGYRVESETGLRGFLESMLENTVVSRKARQAAEDFTSLRACGASRAIVSKLAALV
ncbi:MAG: 3-deoxy-D-manno-octulosonic acid transferase [Desulfobacteraceae bacterium]|nr:3-deoxy-D-manno-octulosonic acid transferase [Desulfobacteraceae bacterium]